MLYERKCCYEPYLWKLLTLINACQIYTKLSDPYTYPVNGTLILLEHLLEHMDFWHYGKESLSLLCISEFTIKFLPENPFEDIQVKNTSALQNLTLSISTELFIFPENEYIFQKKMLYPKLSLRIWWHLKWNFIGHPTIERLYTLVSIC